MQSDKNDEKSNSNNNKVVIVIASLWSALSAVYGNTNGKVKYDNGKVATRITPIIVRTTTAMNKRRRRQRQREGIS